MKRKRGTPDIWIKVTTSKLYAFDSKGIDNRTPEQIVKEFFHDFPLETSHATRDTHRVGNSTKLISAEVLSEEEVTKYIEGKR